MSTARVAVIGTGNIGTDLATKIATVSKSLSLVAVAGIDPNSPGMRRARERGVAVTDQGVDGLIALSEFDGLDIIFDATSAKAHVDNNEKLAPYGRRVVDLTPAALGPFVVPSVNLDTHANALNLNMVTCGGQATIPIVAAVAAVAPVAYAEIVASIASRSAGPGTRANIDEFTDTTARAIESVGGARRGKAIIILNPADPPVIMRDTVHCLVDECAAGDVIGSVEAMVDHVADYVPGYRLKQEVQVSPVDVDEVRVLLPPHARPKHVVSVFLEVEGAGHYLPPYAGNLDIMTSAALRVGEQLAEHAGLVTVA